MIKHVQKEKGGQDQEDDDEAANIVAPQKPQSMVE
jgi:hypothetical protein